MVRSTAQRQNDPPISEEDVLAAVQAILSEATKAGRRARLFSYAVRQVPVGLHFVPELTLTVRLELEPRPTRAVGGRTVIISEEPAADASS